MVNISFCFGFYDFWLLNGFVCCAAPLEGRKGVKRQMKVIKIKLSTHMNMKTKQMEINVIQLSLQLASLLLNDPIWKDFVGKLREVAWGNKRRRERKALNLSFRRVIGIKHFMRGLFPSALIIQCLSSVVSFETNFRDEGIFWWKLWWKFI